MQENYEKEQGNVKQFPAFQDALLFPLKQKESSEGDDMGNVSRFGRPASKDKAVISGEDLLMKCYSDRRLNNVMQEMVMTVDKLLRENGYEFNSAADRDYTSDEVHKFLLSFIRPYIRIKDEPR